MPKSVDWKYFGPLFTPESTYKTYSPCPSGSVSLSKS